ncbi:RNA-binding cell elongation regulator Jag/EloR [Iamia sp.]|uniref:RNA-binding cell elongation regulator Jag/EloR n=1 Tax=Iamia sp. TaxID=2722710 RepID=UPI002BE97FBC|nr:RNA-binding cell elongation regulator Jag/EloR [Iamia sp.]HXH57794.1 RNA-binding cell elongation regulator Jag/EloR [Iamia sp.]
MEWVETAASTVEEAKDKVLENLGIDEADAEIEVLEAPRPGLFGRTKGKARVRARVKPRPHPPKQERRDRKRSSGKGRSDRPTTDKAPTGGRSDAPTAASGDDAPMAAGGGTDPGNEAPPRRSRRSNQSAEPAALGSAPRYEARDKGSSRPHQGDSVDTDTDTLTLDEHVACVESFLSGLVDAFGAEATIEVAEIDDETREVRVIGDDLGLLIGPRGLTLQAVHELARTVVFRLAPEGQEGRVRIDIGGYRERRREALGSFATKIAEDVRSSETAKALEPMSPPDRKVVHDTINGIDGVRTTSEGEEPRRHVVVLPDS